MTGSTLYGDLRWLARSWEGLAERRIKELRDGWLLAMGSDFKMGAVLLVKFLTYIPLH
jgi:hypothetical protein